MLRASLSAWLLLSERVSLREVSRCRFIAMMSSSSNNDVKTHEFQVVRENRSKAVVVLFGWLGAETRHVGTYAQIYNHKGCSTVSGVADTMSLLTSKTTALRDFALEAARHAADLLRKEQNKKIPLYVHVFSNGGAFVLEQLELAIQEEANDDVTLCGQHLLLGAEVFDSAPAYVTPGSALKALSAAVPNLPARFMVSSTVLAYMAIHSIGAALRLQPNRAEEFWSHVRDTRGIASHQVFIYSPNDDITDHAKLEELIEHRKQMEVKITVKKFAKSRHVQHFWTYPKEYDLVIDRLLEGRKKDVKF